MVVNAAAANDAAATDFPPLTRNTKGLGGQVLTEASRRILPALYTHQPHGPGDTLLSSNRQHQDHTLLVGWLQLVLGRYSLSSVVMSGRNRPRASFVKEDIADESGLWNSIVEKIRRCRDLNEEYQTSRSELVEAQEKLGDAEPNSENVATLERMEKLHREGIKIAEEEIRVLLEEPDDLLKNLDTLVSVRAAFEIDPPRQPTNGKPRNNKRRLDTDVPIDSPAPTPEVTTPAPNARLVTKGTSRSGSVAATSIKSETSADTEEKQNKLVVGAEVLHRTRKNQDGYGLLCKIINIIGEGKQRKYEIQDDQPEVGKDPDPPYKVSYRELVPIPASSKDLPNIAKGTAVLAVYPDTSVFYKAEVLRMTKDHCRLRFEGEDDHSHEPEIPRRLVVEFK
ncbi:hypothetical protein FH972_023322 [Carpinus fangiana]|uniref:SGF29 C-terminal domain-containing protein n=1 Tax=Carpinus fangiana TaxID=176857 RepID=A0A5N6KVH7_9ROSI|nr:hypothetical protein FH972_023322 [Carpinus fangiana]